MLKLAINYIIIFCLLNSHASKYVTQDSITIEIHHPTPQL